LGNKIDRGAHRRLGQKATRTINTVDRGITNFDKNIRKVDNTLGKIDRNLQIAQMAGAGTIPVIGNALSGVAGVVHQARLGNHAARNVSSHAKKASYDAKKHSNDLESFNLRKKLENAVSTQADGFV
jgi:hypothetical protein